jgi:hypothetical protein
LQEIRISPAPEIAVLHGGPDPSRIDLPLAP